MGRKWILLAAEAVTLTVGIAIGALGMNIWLANASRTESADTINEETVSSESGEVSSREVQMVQVNAGASQTGAEGLLNREEIRVRVNDGMVQWFDGMKWNEVSSVEALQQEDQFYLAKTALEEFEQQYREQKLAERQSGEQSFYVGVKKKEPAKITTAGTQSTQTASGTAKPQTPVVSQPQTSTPDTSNDDSSDNGWNDDSSSNDSSGDSSDNSSAETPAVTPADTPAETPAEQPAETPDEAPVDEAPAGDNTGDGENMDWSDDYL